MEGKSGKNMIITDNIHIYRSICKGFGVIVESMFERLFCNSIQRWILQPYQILYT